MNLLKEENKIDYIQCLKSGLIGSIGAIPGTIASHPFDAIKIRVQATGSKVIDVIPFIKLNGFYSGLFAGIQQKVLTRGPMFLFSSVGTNICHVYGQLDLTTATFLGSAMSGYMTGFLAAPREWVKILSQRPLEESHGKRVNNPLTISIQNGKFLCSIKRFNAAGIRNGLFDSIFFGFKHTLTEYRENNRNFVESNIFSRFLLSSGCIYGISAISAATIDYAIDVSVKNMMITSPNLQIDGLVKTCISLISTRGLKVFQGLGIKVIEMGVSYYVTGILAVYVVQGFSYFFEK